MGNKEDQIRTAFQQLGMNPEKIRYHPEIEKYEVYIGVEGTDEKFIEGIGAIGSDSPVDSRVDTNKLRMMKNSIDGKKIPGGKIRIQSMMKNGHFDVEIRENG